MWRWYQTMLLFAVIEVDPLALGIHIVFRLGLCFSPNHDECARTRRISYPISGDCHNKQHWPKVSFRAFSYHHTSSYS